MDVTPTHSVINLCKYNGATKGRILQSTSGNIVFGFWNGNSGVAHYHGTGWVSQYPGRFGNNWVLSIQSYNQYWGNGLDYTTRPGATSQPVPGQLGINSGQFVGEVSDFACAEIMVINNIRANKNDIQCLEEYFADKYGLDLVAPRDHESSSPVSLCGVPITALYDA
eukprot:826301_1